MCSTPCGIKGFGTPGARTLAGQSSRSNLASRLDKLLYPMPYGIEIAWYVLLEPSHRKHFNILQAPYHLYKSQKLMRHKVPSPPASALTAYNHSTLQYQSSKNSERLQLRRPSFRTVASYHPLHTAIAQPRNQQTILLRQNFLQFPP